MSLRFRGFALPASLLTAVAVIALAALASGCSRSGSGGSAFPSTFNYPDLTPEQVKELMKSSTVDCVSDCHPAVGMFVRANGHAVYTCTAFLVAPDKAVTNGHCLSDTEARDRSGCDDVLIAFPEAGGFEAEQVGCARILGASRPWASDSERIVPDFAVLALSSPLARPPLKLAAYSGDTRSSIIAMNPDHDRWTPTGHIRRADCVPRPRTLYLPDSDGRGPSMAFGECELVHGNSGSPVVNENGEAWALVHSTITPWPALLDWLKPRVLDASRPTRVLTFGSTLACIHELASLSSDAMPAECVSAPGRFDDVEPNLSMLKARLGSCPANATPGLNEWLQLSCS